MRYTCVGCGAEFEAAGAKVRCPRCLRQHGLTPDAPAAPAAAPAPPARRSWRRIAAVAVIAAMALGGGATLLWRRRPVVVTGALSEGQLRKALAARGVAGGAEVLPFAVDEGVRRFAREHAGGGDDLARGRALAQAVSRLLDDAHAVRWRLLRLPQQPPRPAAELLARLRGGSAGEVYSYEAAALTLAAARAAGLKALLAEIHRQGGHAADPSGAVGAYAVAIYQTTPRAAEAPLGFVDPFGAGAVEQATPLDDVAAVAGFYALRSLAHSGGDGDTAAAYRDAGWAVALAPASAIPLAARAQALMAGGGIRDAIADLRQAAARRDDAPRHTNLAAGYLALQEHEQAQASLRTALAREPGFAPAHLALGALAAFKGDAKTARAEAEAAERIDARAPGLHLLRAQIAAGTGDLAAAEREVRAEMAADAGDERAQLMLYGLLKAQEREDDARAVRENLLAKSRHPDRLRQVLENLEGKEHGR